MSQGDLAMWGARGLQDAQTRAAEYKQQLAEIASVRLRKQFLNMISATDPEAVRIMRRGP